MTMSWAAFKNDLPAPNKVRFDSKVLCLSKMEEVLPLFAQCQEMNLSGATGIVVKARGDGPTYRVQLRTDRTDNRIATSYRANLPTVKANLIRFLFLFLISSYGRLAP